MKKYKELRDSINDCFPEMRALTDGVIIEVPHWNIFGQCFDGTDEYVIFNNCIFNTYDYSNSPVSDIWKRFDESKTEIYRHPMLHNVLSWLNANKIMFSYIHSDESGILKVEQNKTSFSASAKWDFQKRYLKDQSEELFDMLLQVKSKVNARKKPIKQPSK